MIFDLDFGFRATLEVAMDFFVRTQPTDGRDVLSNAGETCF